MWATRVTSGARPVLVDAGGRRGRRAGGQEGAEERKEEKGKLLGADPEVGYWAKPQASTPLQPPHHPPHPSLIKIQQLTRQLVAKKNSG